MENVIDRIFFTAKLIMLKGKKMKKLIFILGSFTLLFSTQAFSQNQMIGKKQETNNVSRELTQKEAGALMNDKFLSGYLNEINKPKPTLEEHRAKLAKIEEMQKTGDETLDDYNKKRTEFLRKRQLAASVAVEQQKEMEKQRQERLKMQALKDELRRKSGLPISRFENPEGGLPMTRENMIMLERQAGREMPLQPPVGNNMPAQPKR